MSHEALVLVLLGLITVLQARCPCDTDLNNFQRFIRDDYAMRVLVLEELPGRLNRERIYRIQVREVFKAKSDLQYFDQVYTTYHRDACSVRLQPGLDYLITGDYRHSLFDIKELTVSSCGWVQSWYSLEYYERNWLRAQPSPNPTPIPFPRRD